MDIGYLDIVVAPWGSLRKCCVRRENFNYLSGKIDFRSRLLILTLIFFLIVPFLLSAQSFKPENPIQFKIKNAGITVDGLISDWEVMVDFDPKKLTQSSIRGKANPESIQTGIKLRDKHLYGREYFHIEKFSFISLESKSFRSKGKNFKN